MGHMTTARVSWRRAAVTSPHGRPITHKISSETGMGVAHPSVTPLWKVPTIGEWLQLGATAVLLLSTVAACATVKVVPAEQLYQQQFAEGTEPVAHVYADNWGWYLLKIIPIVTGNLDKPGIPRLPRFFTNNVQPDKLVEKIAEESQKLGGSIMSDVRVRDRSAYQPLTLIFWLNEFEASANVSRRGPEGGKNEK